VYRFAAGCQIADRIGWSIATPLLVKRWSAGDTTPTSFQRIYGATRSRLLRDFRKATSRAMVDRISLTELKEFVYWLFKRRIAMQDPARVASDTRRGLQRIQTMEELRRQRHPAASGSGSRATVIEGIAIPIS